MLGELTKGTCSMFGAWGSAVPSGDGILQLRALDWNMDGEQQSITSGRGKFFSNLEPVLPFSFTKFQKYEENVAKGRPQKSI